ncbi:PAS domain S-box protein [bacterium]|nr:PAS domain S-box protein [candidate division CSSED10-310 bacterium]
MTREKNQPEIEKPFEAFVSVLPLPACVLCFKNKSHLLLEYINEPLMKILPESALPLVNENIFPHLNRNQILMHAIRKVHSSGSSISNLEADFSLFPGLPSQLKLSILKMDGDRLLLMMQTHSVNSELAPYLKDLEAKYHAISIASPAAQIFADLEGNILSANDGAVSMFGYGSMSELKSIKTTELYQDPSVRNRVVEKLKQGVLQNERVVAVRADGTTFPGLLSGVIVNLDDRLFLYGQITDITGVEQLENKIVNIELRYQYVLEHLGEGVLFLSYSHNISLMNPAAEQMAGIRSREWAGKHISELDSECRFPEFFKVLSKSLENKLPAVINIPLVSESGESRMGEMKVMDIGSGFLCQIRDVTNQKMLEKQREKAKQMEATGLIAGQIAHDFNNLLTPLVSLPDIIKKKIPTDNSIHRLMDYIQKAGEQMFEYNQQLLSLSKKGYYELKPLSLNSLIETFRMIKVLPERITIQTYCDPDLKQILGDASQILRVLINLLKNASDAMNQIGTVKLVTENQTVMSAFGRSRKIPPGEYVVVSCIDSGKGLPVGLYDKIFDPFFTTKNTGNKYGLGLGLNIADEIVREHQGVIDFYQNPDKGMTFSVYLPAYYEVTSQGSMKISITVMTEPATILVVDDNEMHISAISEMLKHMGHIVTSTLTAQEAVDVYSSRLFDIVILDIMLGEMNGVELYEKMMTLRDKQPVIFMSAYTHSEIVEKAKAIRSGMFLQKPLRFKELQHAISMVTHSIDLAK